MLKKKLNNARGRGYNVSVYGKKKVYPNLIKKDIGNVKLLNLRD